MGVVAEARCAMDEKFIDIVASMWFNQYRAVITVL